MPTEALFELWKNRVLLSRAFMLNGEIDQAIKAKREELLFEETIIDRCGKDAFVKMLDDDVKKWEE